ncbi:hypothetical protein RJ640_028456 [Escallonia rubra]|uniref:TIR domain-containing protein n=1 Tax=Escallonia rubra TaxID=112253 RepID=A0AA88U2A6_9ASTE|nr:hypothetical protein RJ640_028456 [Escallonia rubra]
MFSYTIVHVTFYNALLSSKIIDVAASSSSTPPRWMYDVFLSFRGEDVRKNFVDHLHVALGRHNIRTFKDDEDLESGSSISPELVKAIEGSRFAIVIFSQNYASSSWCLDELVKIIECKNLGGLTTVLPVFYHVDPSDVRKQTGSFAKALEHHDRIKVSNWRQALTEAANTSGWDVEKEENGHEAKVVSKLVAEVFRELDHPVSNVEEDLVGIDSRVDEVKSLLELGTDTVRFIGIWGMGGIGKTTVAWEVFKNICSQFECAIFVHDVREKSKKYGLESLQEIMILEIRRQRDVKVRSILHGVQLIWRYVSNKRALVILDDVDHMAQVNAFAGGRNWFGKGSRIIITTRDKKILVDTNVAKIHPAGLLGPTDSVKLFNKNAFKNIHHPEEFKELCDLIVKYAGGLPLALKVLGAFLHGRDIEMWESTVARLRDIPEDDIIKKLRVSFDYGLKPIEQEIFLDIACFLKGMKVDYAKQVLDSFGFHSKIGIPVLVDKSLIVISEGELQMHDLMQEMGRHIVRQFHPRHPEKRNRLWDPQEVVELLTQNTGTEAAEGLQLDLPEPTEVDCSSDALKKMDRLRLLIFRNVYFSQGVEYLPNQLRWLSWHGYPSKSLPTTFKAANLVGLDLPWSQLEQFWTEGKRGNKLKFIDLTHSQKLIGTPDFSEIPNLQILVLQECISLKQVHESIAFHKNLVLLDMGGCKKLRSLPDKIQLVSLEKLNLSNCIRLDKFPDIQGDMNSLSELYLDETGIEELPSSIERLKNLGTLDLSRCRCLRSLPSSIFSLRSLRSLDLSGCELLLKFPDIQRDMDSLYDLSLDGTGIEELPSSIERLKNLKTLDLSRCRSLRSVPSSIFSLRSLEFLDLSGCELLLKLPDIQRDMDSLTYLSLDETGIEELPSSIERLKNLSTLVLSMCRSLRSVPSSIFSLRSLESLCLSGCELLLKLPDIQRDMDSLSKLLLNGTGIEELPSSIERLKNLVTLSLCDCRCLRSLPSSIFSLRSLRSLRLSGCELLLRLPDIQSDMDSLSELLLDGTGIEELPSSIERLKNLETLDLSRCRCLRSLPSSIFSLRSLRSLRLSGCELPLKLLDIQRDMDSLYELSLDGTGIEELPSSIERLKNLKTLDLSRCRSLRSVPSSIFSLRSLESLCLSGCELLLKFPDIQRDMDSLYDLSLDGTGIEELPSSIERLKNLVLLDLSRCRSLRSVPSSIFSLRSLRSLDLSFCESLLKLPDIQRDMDRLFRLLLNGTGIEELPSSIERLKNLETLDLSRCRCLRSLPSSIFSLRSLRSLRLSGCELLLRLPDIQSDMDSLSELLLDGTGIEELPSSIERLKNLETLDLSGCRCLRSLPSSIFSLRSLKSLKLSGCELLLKCPDIQRDMDSLYDLSLDGTGIVPQSWRSSVVLPSVSGLSSLVKLVLSHQNLTALPSNIMCLSSLLELDIGGNNFVSLPSSIVQIPRLQILRLEGCKKLQVLPDLPPSIIELHAND